MASQKNTTGSERVPATPDKAPATRRQPAKAAAATTDKAPRAARSRAVAPVPAARSKAARPVPAERRRHYVEVAAYYIAERRGFASGDETADWLAAEAEIDRLIADKRLKA